MHLPPTAPPTTTFTHSLPILRNPQPNNRLLTRMARSIAPPSIVTNRLLHFILIIAPEPRTNLPLPIASLHDLIHDVLFGILVRAAEVLHQLLDRAPCGYKQLNVLRGIFFEHGSLPGLLFGLEDVDLAVFLREGVVVAWWEANTAGVVAEVDAREAVVGKGGDGWVGHAAHAEASVWRHEHRLLREARECSWPAEGLRSRRPEESWVLRHAKWLGWAEAWRHGAVVEAMECVESSASHVVHFLGCSRRNYLGWWLS